MAGTGTFEGANARLYVDTKPAMAQLKALQAYAMRTRALMQGMPIANTGTDIASPLLAPVPSGEIPGSRLDYVASDIAIDAGSNKPRKGKVIPMRSKQAQKAAGNAVSKVTDKAERAASRKAAAPFAKTFGGTSAAAATTESLMDRHKANLIKELGEVRLESGGATIGGYGFGPKGFALESMVMRTLGPAAGLAVATGAGIYLGTKLSDMGNDIIYEAAERGVAVGTVAKERGVEALRNAGGAVWEAGAFAVNKIYDLWRAQTELGVNFFGEMAGHLPEGSGRKVGEFFEYAQGSVDDFISELLGEPTRGERQQTALREIDAKFKVARSQVVRNAKQQAIEASGVLQGLGFTGTRKSLAQAAVDAGIGDTVNEDVAALNREEAKQKEAAITNGKQ